MFDLVKIIASCIVLAVWMYGILLVLFAFGG